MAASARAAKSAAVAGGSRRLAVCRRVDVALRAGQLGRHDALDVVRAQGETGLGRDPEAGGDQRLHHDHVVGAGADPRIEPGVGAHGQQVAAAALAAGDPRRVAQGGEPTLATRRQQIDRIVE